jgi:DNA primase
VFSFDGDAAGRRAARKALDGALPYATDVRTVKFLFLPPEHDPDSYIREHGRDAFARYIGEATPLSRFLVESAREGCDPSTAEGRAHMAANAKPLWSLLPDGALKRQLLVEIAELTQLEPRDLAALWTGQKLGSSTAPNKRKSRWKPDGEAAQPRRSQGRVLPPGRADRALQIMLSDSQAWDRLSHDDHHMLCALPAPHGPMFSWLDARVHDEGPQPWESLRAALAGHEHQGFALELMSRLPPAIENDPDELARILQRERDQRRAEEMKALSLRAASDPAAYERLKELVASSRAKPA